MRHRHASNPVPELGRGYWWTWSSSGLSNLADGVLKVGIPLVGLEFTRSPALIAGLTVAFTLPWLLFALPAGALADRVDRRRAMVGANLLRATLLGALAAAVALGGGSIWALYLVAFCVGSAETVYDTSAQSIVPQLVSRDQLSRANARSFAVELTANEFIGPPLASVLVLGGAAATFASSSVCWLAAVGALLLVNGRFKVAGPTSTSLRADIAQGLRYLWKQRLLRKFAVLVGVFNLASNAVFALLPFYAVGPEAPMCLSAPGFGLLLASTAVGSLLGALLAERVERSLGRARTLWVTFLGGAFLVGIPAITTNAYVVGAFFVIGGFCVVCSNVVLVSLRQRISPDRLLGRVNSAYRLTAWGTKPLGAVSGGVLAEWIGLRPTFAVMGVIALGVAAATLSVTEAALTAAELAPVT